MKVADRLADGGRVLVMVPNLELLSQMLATFTSHAVAGPGRVVAVCSTVEVIRAADLGIEAATVTTDPAELAACAAGPGRVTVLCTYQSLGALAAAHADHQLPAWDLAVIDEAHRTAGRSGKAWALIHDDVIIPARRRLYMTATRKILGSSGDDALVSMDDEKIFGPVVFRFSTAEGIKRGLLADYEVLVVVVTDTQIKELTEGEDRLRLGDTTVNPRMLAVQIAVLRAARQYQITRAITYHNRVRDARAWAQTLPSAWQMMPDQQRPAAVSADHIDGDQPIPRRRTVLDRLRADPHTDAPGTLRVVCNARVLVEGVDAPAVDAIVLVDPRRSVIDTVQAVGRALRTGGRTNKTARILVPVLLGPEEDPESALEGSAYAQVWQVARALRAHDDRLASGMDTARAAHGHTRYHASGQRPGPEQEGTDWLRVCGVPVPTGFAQAIQLRAVQAASSTWMEYYGAARAFHHAHGHLDLPVSYLTHDGLKLGQWLRNQRRNRAHLSAERVQLLDAIAMPWTSATTRAWDKGLTAARTWARDHNGSLHNIPRDVRYDGVALCEWLVRRRKDLDQGRLSADHKAALDAIDPTWHNTDALWDQHYTAARAFHNEHGHLRPDPTHRTTSGLNLHLWLAKQRQLHRTGELRPQRKNQLDAINMTWSLPQAHWQHGLAAARTHATTHGSLDVPVEYRTKDGFGLGVWLRTQRRQAHNNRLPTHRRAALDAIDPAWHTTTTRATRWAARYNAAKAYATKHGHLPKGRGAAADPAPDGPDFRPWLREQRQLARRGKLPTERKTALDKLDPHWLNNPPKNQTKQDRANTATPPDDDNPTSDTH